MLLILTKAGWLSTHSWSKFYFAMCFGTSTFNRWVTWLMGSDSYVLLWNVWSEVEKHRSFFPLSLFHSTWVIMSEVIDSQRANMTTPPDGFIFSPSAIWRWQISQLFRMPIYHIFKTRHLLKEIKLLNNRKFNPRLSPISSKIVEIFIERRKNSKYIGG